ncbi:MAG: hypothetical protein JWQ50_711 [Caballeronia mineralivorans]|nr:hypothetical protein [Caballeronia mineralivorans]
MLPDVMRVVIETKTLECRKIFHLSRDKLAARSWCF